jgi:hypothetical protein
MVLEYSNLSFFKTVYDWQLSQSGEPKELVELEKLACENDLDGLKKHNSSSDWPAERLMKWLVIEPFLTGVDLRDYFWLSRDYLEKSISGSSLIPPAIRSLSKELVDFGSASILNKTITEKITGVIEGNNLELLISLLEKELLKAPENDRIHKVYIELMAQNINGSVESYKRIIPQLDNDKIPFSLRNDFVLATKRNQELADIGNIFHRKSKIYTAFLKS